MQTSIAFLLTVCDSNYSPQPKESAGSDPVLKTHIFLEAFVQWNLLEEKDLKLPFLYAIFKFYSQVNFCRQNPCI